MLAQRSIEHWLVMGFAAAAVAAVVVLGVLVDPDPRGFGTHEKLGLPPCKMMEWWHVPCPGCGVTTSVSLAAHGHFWASIVNQPFGFLCALGVPVFALFCLSTQLRGRDLNEELHRWKPGKLALAITCGVVLAWVYKIAVVEQWIG